MVVVIGTAIGASILKFVGWAAIGTLLGLAVKYVLEFWHGEKDPKKKPYEKLVNAALEEPAPVRKTIEELAAFALKNPKKFVEYGRQMGQQKFFQVMEKLKTAAGGREAGAMIVREVAANTWLARWGPWLLKLPRPLFHLAMFIAGASMAALFLIKEIPECPGFGTWAAIEAGNWPVAQVSNDRYKHWIDTIAATPLWAAIVRLPVVGPICQAVTSAQIDQQTTFDQVISSHLPETGTVEILVSPSNVRVVINGVPHQVRDSWRYELAPGHYRIAADKEGYISQVREIDLLPGETHAPVVFDLRQGEPAEGQIRIDCTPAAEIWIAGTDTGRQTPAEMSFVPGTVDIELRCNGYRTERRTLYISSGRNDPVSVTLLQETTPRQETHAYVSIYVIPLGAYVFVDGVISPYPSPTHLDLLPGTYTITVRKSGYVETRETITVSAGETKRLEFIMEEVSPEAPPAGVPLPGEDVWNVTIETMPSGGRTFINGSMWTYPAPTVIPLLAGTYEFRFTLKGYKEIIRTMPVP